MKTTRTYRTSSFANDLSDLSNISHSAFVESQITPSVNFSGTKSLHDYKNFKGNLSGTELDNTMSNADGSLTPAEIQAIWKDSGTTLSFQEWVKTSDSREALAYAIQKKSNPASLSSRELKKLWKESGSKLSIDAWAKTDAGKGAITARLHEKSGSKQSIGDWLKSDNAKSLITNATLLTALALGSTQGVNNSGESNSYTDTRNTNTEQPLPKDKSGIHPITILVFGTIGLAGAYFGIKYYIKHK